MFPFSSCAPNKCTLATWPPVVSNSEPVEFVIAKPARLFAPGEGWVTLILYQPLGKISKEAVCPALIFGNVSVSKSKTVWSLPAVWKFLKPKYLQFPFLAKQIKSLL